MKKLLIALFIIGFIAGCGDNPTDSKDEFKEKIVGNWKLTSETNAEYIGSQQAKIKLTTTNAEGDTVIIDQPNQYSLTLVKKDMTEYTKGYTINFDLTFRDSSLSNSSNIDIDNYNFLYQTDSYTFDIASKRQGLTDNYFEAEAGIYYDCWENVPDKNIEIQLISSDGNPFRLYIVKSDGFADVLTDNFCISN